MRIQIVFTLLVTACRTPVPGDSPQLHVANDTLVESAPVTAKIRMCMQTKAADGESRTGERAQYVDAALYRLCELSLAGMTDKDVHELFLSILRASNNQDPVTGAPNPK